MQYNNDGETVLLDSFLFFTAAMNAKEDILCKKCCKKKGSNIVVYVGMRNDTDKVYNIIKDSM